METITFRKLKTDFVVVGGGLAGLCAAVAAARNGAKTVLIQDRPVLGGNSSSEIRISIGGAYGIRKNDGSVQEFREGGIIEELLLLNLYLNPTLRWTIWDHIMFQFAKAEPNLTLLLNTSVQSLKKDGNRIESVTGWHLTEYCFYTVEAGFFADCSGDSILRLSGAECMRGREGKKVFGESFAPDHSDEKTMGSSATIMALPTLKENFRFRSPATGLRFTEETIPHQLKCRLKDSSCFTPAALETGGTLDTIKEADKIRDELFELACGYWDFIKNTPGHDAEQWNLEWIGSLPGKRESFRYIGDHVLNQNDIEKGGHFPDAVCHGGWPMDDHFPEGWRYPGGQTVMHPAPTPYGIPFRSLYSINIENLFFAGRNISASHMALSSTRVMGTCAVMGQAVGTAAALASRLKTTPRQIGKHHITELQKLLQDQDQFIPFQPRKISQLSLNAGYSHEVLRDGIDRSLLEEDHGVWFSPGDSCSCQFAVPTEVSSVRITVDTDCTDNTRLRNQWESSASPRKMPPMMPRDFNIDVFIRNQWETVREIRDNHRRYLVVSLKKAESISAIRIVWNCAWGNKKMHVFSFEIQ